MSPARVLHGTAVTLRPVQPEDAGALTEILATPEVARWWPRYDAERVRAEFLEDSESVVFTVLADGGDVIGSIQYYEEPSPDYRHAGMDVFLHPAWHGKGLGTDTVRTLCLHLFHDLGHHRLAIDPSVDNRRAIRTYERVGFKPVGVLRAYERGLDDDWHDCLLMDLLRHELR